METIINSIFKAYDVRGKVGDELTAELVETIGKAFGLWLPGEGAVAIGRDMRPDSAEFATAFTRGLNAVGKDVVDIGEVTSDMIYFATGQLKLAGGVMITASHNPGEYNGIKFCQEGARPVGVESGLLEVRDLTIQNNFKTTEQPGSVTSKDVIEPWIEHVLSFVNIKKLKPLKIVVDAGNGMAGKIFPELEPYVPFDVTEMYFELDGSFPNHIANPVEPENIKDLIARVKKEKADVGIAFDADGDRAVLIDEKGKPLSGTVLTAMLAKYLLRAAKNATILYNATCGWIVPETISDNGGKSVRTKVGHSYIKAEMRKYSAIFGGESSGHYYFKDNYMADSGLIAAVIALALISENSQPLSKIADDFRKYHQIPETNFTVSNKDAIMQHISKEFTDQEQDWLDGLTIWFNDAWLNVRPSNTEPILRLNMEAKSPERIDALVAKVTAIIKK